MNIAYFLLAASNLMLTFFIFSKLSMQTKRTEIFTNDICNDLESIEEKQCEIRDAISLLRRSVDALEMTVHDLKEKEGQITEQIRKNFSTVNDEIKKKDLLATVQKNTIHVSSKKRGRPRKHWRFLDNISEQQLITLKDKDARI